MPPRWTLRRSAPALAVAVALFALLAPVVVHGAGAGAKADVGDYRQPASARVVATSNETVGGVAAVRESGYLTVRDGIELAYSVVRPADASPAHSYPLLLTYDGYDAGSNPDASYISRYLPRGYAFMGLSVRGTSCSGGIFDFFQPAEGYDGYQAIEWAAAQAWSNGRVSMIGKSYPGITQLFVAETQPPHLVSIAPGHFFTDAYRDVAYPGGILNYAFAAAWSFISQPEPGYVAGFDSVLARDETCIQHQKHNATNLRHNPLEQAAHHPYDDPLYAERSPMPRVDQIKVPVYVALAWQDEQLASRQSHILNQFEADGIPYRAVLSNGDHGMYRRNPQMAELDRFFDATLKESPVLADGTPLANYQAEPPVSIFWEQGASGPRWRTTLNQWHDKATAMRLFAGPSGTLTQAAPTAATSGTDIYAYSAAGSQGIGNPRYGYPSLPDIYMWDKYTPPSGSTVAYTSAPFGTDATFLGSASADLWLSATAPNVDLQVTLTEVRPDGQEEFVQQGWLRASHRKLDPSSTELLPIQTHQQGDLANLPLKTANATEARVEIFPFGHVVRAGSRLRMWIEAPTVLPQLWAFALDPTPAAVTISRDPLHPTSLALPLLNGAGPVPFGLPACGSVYRQPCRPDPLKS
jgi:putative CocE/NonD family hydrolase